MDKQQIIQTDLNGVHIAIFNSALDASRALGLERNKIALCCDGKADRVKNFRFKYADKDLNSQAELVRLERRKMVSDNHKSAWAVKRKKVYQFSLTGDLITSYLNLDEAAINSGISKIGIKACCNGKTYNCNGFVWSYNNTPNIISQEIPTENGEEWRDVIGYEGLYKVSSYGRIWSVRRYNHLDGTIKGGVMMRPRIDKRNRMYVALTGRNKKSKNLVPARLVAKAFIPNPDNLPQVNHKDENPLNNHVSNLEWCTAKYNCNYGTRMQRIKEAQNIPILQYTLQGEFIAEYASMHIAAEAINADAGHICDCCKGNRKWAYGYLWRYKDDALYQQAKAKLKVVIERGRQSRRDSMSKALGKPVKQYDLDGNFIKEYPSSRHASEELNIKRPYIFMCISGKMRQAGGYLWTH